MMDRKPRSAAGGPTRRQVIRHIGAPCLAAGAGAPLARRARAQGKTPISLSFWTFDNPQQRPWLNKRIKLFTDQNPNVKVDFQWFPFADLRKKLSVGRAAGTR